MIITRISPLTGRAATMDLPVTQDQLDEFAASRRTRLIQDIFPGLSADEREFIMTGYTRDDWDKLFPPEEAE